MSHPIKSKTSVPYKTEKQISIKNLKISPHPYFPQSVPILREHPNYSWLKVLQKKLRKKEKTSKNI